MDPEALMHLRPKNTQEKLLWERQSNKLLLEEIKTLDEEIKRLKEELSELRQLFKKEQIGSLIIKNQALKRQNKEKDKKLRKYRRDTNSLIERLASLEILKISSKVE